MFIVFLHYNRSLSDKEKISFFIPLKVLHCVSFMTTKKRKVFNKGSFMENYDCESMFKSNAFQEKKDIIYVTVFYLEYLFNIANGSLKVGFSRC